jgi:glycosyltransferase involved in cell wall biosynthesis
MALVYPIPRQLATNPYLDQLYAPFAAWPEWTLRRIPFTSAVRELLTRREPRIVHWHFFDELTQQPGALATAGRTLAFLALLRATRLSGARIVWTAHNLEPHELRHARWAERAYQAMFRQSDAVIAHSQSAATLLSERYRVRKNIHIIPLGSGVGLYGPRRERAAGRAALGLDEHEFLALNVGAVRPYKGLELLLEAWEGIAGRLIIAGGVKDAASADQLRAAGAGRAGVDLRLQFVPDADLPLWFAAADVLVLPYRKLLTSAVLLWAMSYGVPVVAPDLPPVRELVQEGQQGFLFAPGDQHSLHAALERAATHPDLGALGERAYQAALPFDWPSIAGQTAALYQEVLASR